MPQTHAVAPAAQPATSETHEFTLPCVQQTAACSGYAAWAVRSTHGLNCPQDGAVCGACREYLEASWADAIRRGIRCANCHIPVIGMLSDHLRFLAL